MQIGSINSNPLFMSSLNNDTHFAYTKRFHMDYTTMDPNYILKLDSVTSKDKIYSIMLSSSSYCNSSEIVKFDLMKRTVSGESTTLLTIYCDLKDGCTIDTQDIVIDAGESLYLEYKNNDLDHQITIVANQAQFDLVLFCKKMTL